MATFPVDPGGGLGYVCIYKIGKGDDFEDIAVGCRV